MGESPKFTATVKDEYGQLVDPTIMTISIRKSNREMAVTDEAMTRESIGIYTYIYTIPAEIDGVAGTYRLKVEGTGSANRVTIEPDTFDVEVSI